MQPDSKEGMIWCLEAARVNVIWLGGMKLISLFTKASNKTLFNIEDCEPGPQSRGDSCMSAVFLTFTP